MTWTADRRTVADTGMDANGLLKPSQAAKVSASSKGGSTGPVGQSVQPAATVNRWKKKGDGGEKPVAVKQSDKSKSDSPSQSVRLEKDLEHADRDGEPVFGRLGSNP